MKILITGGCGFVGSNLAIFLKKNIRHSSVYSLDNLFRKGSTVNEKRLKLNNIKNYRINISNYKEISKLQKFNIIIDCCAEPSVEASEIFQDRVINTNLIGTFNILKKCKKDKSALIFLSSSRVYSINNLINLVKNKNIKKKLKKNFKINEDFETSSPKSLYGATKFFSEELIKEYNYSCNLKYLINRFGVIAGPWQFGKQDQGFVSLWVYKHIFKKPLSYIGFGGNGHQIRDIIHIDDVAEIILKQITKIKTIYNKTFNIGGGVKNSISLNELTKLCSKITYNKILVKKVKNTSKYDIPYYITNNKKIKLFYNWKPKKNIKDVVKDIYIWIKSNKKLISKYIS